MGKVSYKRHIAKTITWRVIGTIDTILLSWLITGNPLTGLKIGFSEVITKLVLYYAHERIWTRLNIIESKKRHLIKTISWRLIGTIDTMILSWFVSGSPTVGFQIGALEVVTKMLLYYLHERTWYSINYGLLGRRLNKQWEKI